LVAKPIPSISYHQKFGSSTILVELISRHGCVPAAWTTALRGLLAPDDGRHAILDRCPALVAEAPDASVQIAGHLERLARTWLGNEAAVASHRAARGVRTPL
jgi:hypothetical protein